MLELHSIVLDKGDMLIIFQGFLQGSHRFEKYLNLEGFLEKSLKIKSTLENHLKALKSP